MGGLRYIASGVILGTWLKLQGHPLPGRDDWGRLAVLGFFMLMLGNGGVVWGEQYRAERSHGGAHRHDAVLDGQRGRDVSGRPADARAAVDRTGDRVLRASCCSSGRTSRAAARWPRRRARRDRDSDRVCRLGARIGLHAAARDAARPARLGGVQMLFGGVIMTHRRDADRGVESPVVQPADDARDGVSHGLRRRHRVLRVFVRARPPGHRDCLAVPYINPVIAVILGILILGEPFALRMLVAAAIIVVGILIVRKE